MSKGASRSFKMPFLMLLCAFVVSLYNFGVCGCRPSHCWILPFKKKKPKLCWEKQRNQESFSSPPTCSQTWNSQVGWLQTLPLGSCRPVVIQLKDGFGYRNPSPVSEEWLFGIRPSQRLPEHPSPNKGVGFAFTLFGRALEEGVNPHPVRSGSLWKPFSPWGPGMLCWP